MKKIKFLYLILLTILVSACNKVLDVSPTDKYSEETAWKNEVTLDLYAAGFYAALRDNSEIGGTNLSDGYSDILKYSTNSQAQSAHNRVLLQDNFITSASGQLSAWGNYGRIRRLNEFLFEVDSKAAHLNQNFIAIRKAEIRFIRAFLYYKMIRAHGGIVLRTAENGLDSEKEKDKARSTEEESWNFVITEFEAVAEILPLEWDNVNLGRLTKGAAYGFMARCALYAKKYDKAIEAGLKVVALADQGKYALQSSYASIFNTKFNKELLLAVYYKKPDYKHTFDSWFAPSGDIAGSGGLAGPTEELVSQYDVKVDDVYIPFDWANPIHAENPYANREPRFYASVLYNGAPWKGRALETYVNGKDGFLVYNSSNSTSTTVTGYYFKKFLDENNMFFNTDGSDRYWVEMRYAEILLILAEAYAESPTSNLNQALVYLNKVRARAELPEKGAANKTEFMTALRKERMIELAFEGHRYWDLRRWRLAQTVINGQSATGIKITKASSGKLTYERVDVDAGAKRFFPEKYYLIPIPEEELSNNVKAIQNPLW